MEQYETKRLKISERVLQRRAHLRNRMVLWCAISLAGLVGLVFASPLYKSTGKLYMSYRLPQLLDAIGTLSLMALILGFIAAVAYGLEYWESIEEDVTETIETKRIKSDGPLPRARLVNRRSPNRITLSRWKFDDEEWLLIISRLKDQEWRFNRDVFKDVVDNLTKNWPSLLSDWQDNGYIYQKSRSHWVRKKYRRQLMTPPAPTAAGVLWRGLQEYDDDDDDDDERKSGENG